MTDTQLSGEGQDLKGKVKETAGDLTGDRSLQGEGLTDQVTGKLQKAFGKVGDAAGANPLTDKARTFARERPWATAALAGVLGVALLNTLRGKR